jgi:hypothetical protein
MSCYDYYHQMVRWMNVMRRKAQGTGRKGIINVL